MQERFGRRTGADAVMQYSVVWLGATLTDPVVGSSTRFVTSTFVPFALVLHVSSALAPRCRSRGLGSNESSTCCMDAIVGGGTASASEGSVDLRPQPTNWRAARTRKTAANPFICHPDSAALAPALSLARVAGVFENLWNAPDSETIEGGSATWVVRWDGVGR